MDKIRVAVTGVSGRMGSNLVKLIIDNPATELTQALDRASSEIIGTDVGIALNLGKKLNIIVAEQLVADKFDVLIDFTRPEATLTYLKFCQEHNKAIVIGTTGFNSEDFAKISAAGKAIPIVFSANYSIGVNLVFKLLAEATKVMANSDIEIIEAHHRHKIDAPSGTALAMGEVIAETLTKDLSSIAKYDRFAVDEARKTGEIGFSSIRAADIVGEHTVIFAEEGERVEISHKATDRKIFARGAIRAAIWLVQQAKVGLFNMQNVLQ